MEKQKGIGYGRNNKTRQGRESLTEKPGKEEEVDRMVTQDELG